MTMHSALRQYMEYLSVEGPAGRKLNDLILEYGTDEMRAAARQYWLIHLDGAKAMNEILRINQAALKRGVEL